MILADFFKFPVKIFAVIQIFRNFVDSNLKQKNMYSDDIDLARSSSCICRNPEEWKA